MTYKARVLKDGQLVPLLPEVYIGNERLNKNKSSRMSGKFVTCDEHGTVPYCFVQDHGMITLVCRKCVLENCQLTTAIERPGWSGDGDPEDPNSNQGPQMDNPVGHSY